MASTVIRDRAARLADLGLQYVGPGPAAGTTWAYDAARRTVVVEREDAEVDAGTPGAKGRAVVRASELIAATRTSGHVVVYAAGARAVGVRAPLPEHLHACRDRNGRLSENLGDEIHPAGECTTWVPFNPAALASVDHIQATPQRPLTVIGGPTAATATQEPIEAVHAGTCGLCWGTYQAGACIVLAHPQAFGSVHTTCAERADRPGALPSYYAHAAD